MRLIKKLVKARKSGFSLYVAIPTQYVKANGIVAGTSFRASFDGKFLMLEIVE